MSERPAAEKGDPSERAPTPLNSGAAPESPDLITAKKYPRPAAEAYGTSSARGGIIMSVVQLLTGLITFGSHIALAWFLTPADFGVVAVALSIAGIVAVLRDAGAQVILVQRQREFERIAPSVFWLAMSSSILCALITAAAAPVVAHFQKNPIIIPLMLLIAARFPISTMGSVSISKLTIDMRWGALGAIGLLQPAVTAAAAIAMAALGFGVYSLVIPMMLGEAARGVVTWWVAGTRVRLAPSWQLIMEMIGSSAFIVLTNLSVSIRGFLDYLILGLIRTEHETGLYFYAFTLAHGMSRLGFGAIPNILAPVFSKVQDDQARYSELVTRAMHMSAAVYVLPIVLQASLAWPIFRLFLDARWEPAAPLFALTSIAMLLTINSYLLMRVLWTKGYYRRDFYYSSILTVIMVGGFYLGARIAGATGVAWAVVIGYLVDTLLMPLVTLPLLKIGVARAMLPLWRPLVAALPAAATAFLLHWTLPITLSADLLRIVLIGAIGTAGYVTILFLLWRDVSTRVFQHLRAALGTLASKFASDPIRPISDPKAF